jgi:hypothetical protein
VLDVREIDPGSPAGVELDDHRLRQDDPSAQGRKQLDVGGSGGDTGSVTCCR